MRYRIWGQPRIYRSSYPKPVTDSDIEPNFRLRAVPEAVSERLTQSGTETITDVFHNRIPSRTLNRLLNRLPSRGNRVSANQSHRSLARPDVSEIRDFS